MKRNFIAAVKVATIATLSVGFVNITPKVIYGDDNRLDVYAVPRSDVREIADSTVALIPTSSLVFSPDGTVKLVSTSFGKKRRLCSEEAFFDQPTAANCSGSLVGEDLIATAGHCVAETTCASFKYVFGFRMQDEKTVTDIFPDEEVYSCKEIVSREYTADQDYALIRLDRVVKGHRPLTLQQTPVQPGDGIYVIGHPAGLPTKMADGAVVRSQRGSFFQSNLDTYGGNSGSAVFNARTNEVVGILVRGASDFVYDSARQCTKSNVCTEAGCRGEDVTNISYIVDALKK